MVKIEQLDHQPMDINKIQAQPAMPSVTIVIVTWNAAGDIEECLDSIEAQTHSNLQVLIVDSDSSDNTLDIVQARYPAVKIIACRENVGYRRGNRIGMLAADSDYVLVCNDDIRVEPDWLANMVVRMESDPTIGLVTPMIIDYFKPPLISAAGNTLHYTGTSGHVPVRGIPKDAYKGGAEIAAVAGCCFMLRRTLVQQLGGFSEDFDQYQSGFHASLEEADLGWRAQLLGYRIELVEDAILYHKHNWKRLHAKRFASRECGRYLTVLRNFEVRTILLLIPVFLLLEMMTMTMALVKGKEWARLKVEVWWWILRNWQKIRAMRQRVQKTRKVADDIIIRRMSPTIHFAYTIGYGRLGGLINFVANGIFVAYYRLLCATVYRAAKAQ